MGERLSFLIPVYADPASLGDGVVERTVEILRDHGFAAEWDGRDDYTYRYELESDDVGTRREGPIGEAIEAIADDGGGKLTLRYADQDVRATFRLETDDETEWPPISVGGPDEYAFDEESVSLATARERADDVHGMIADLASAFDPWLVVGRLRSGHDDGTAYPDERPPDSGLQRLSWIDVFGGEWFDRFGGKERLFDAPAYAVEDLSNGAVLVRISEIPRNVRSDATEPGELSAYEYLFEGRSLADQEAALERSKRTYVDPFRSLDPGEIGSDVLVCRDHADFDLPGVDYDSVPPETEIDPCGLAYCRRGEDGGLWHAESDTFVRRLIGEDGTPVGDLPKDVDPDEEFVSTLVGTEYDDPVGADTIRVEDLDDRSLLEMVYSVAGRLADPGDHEEADSSERDDGGSEPGE